MFRYEKKTLIWLQNMDQEFHIQFQIGLVLKKTIGKPEPNHLFYSANYKLLKVKIMIYLAENKKIIIFFLIKLMIIAE